MATHTPGPWNLVDRRSPLGEDPATIRQYDVESACPSRKMARWRAEDSRRKQDTFDAVTVCQLATHWNGSGQPFGPIDGLIDPDEVDANARLIAASPELAEACAVAILWAKTPGPGSISSGTLKSDDLLQAYADALAFINPVAHRGLCGEAYELVVKMRDKDLEPGEDLEEAAEFLLEDLTSALENYAPEGHYFGAHPGDGADIGFWPTEDEDHSADERTS